MSHHSHSSPSWSELPPELLRSIADGLNPNYDDIERFRCVCKNWRLATPPSLRLYPVLPQNVYPDYQNSFSCTAVYLLRQCRHRNDSSSAHARNTWMVTVEQSHDGKLHVLHPIILRPIGTLPQNFLPHALANVDSTREVTRSFDIKYSNNHNTNILRNHFMLINKNNPNKVMLWPNPKLKSPGPRDHSYMVLQEGNLLKHNLGCFRTTQGYRDIEYGSRSRFDDIVHWKGLIFAVDYCGRLYGIEYDTLHVVTVFVTTPISYTEHQHNQLLVWNSKMYLVTLRYSTVKVYELNEECHRWEVLTTLGDRILFVRQNNCFLIRASDLPGCQENCVVVIPSFDKKVNKSKIPQHASSLFKGADGYVKVRVYKYGERGKNFKLISLCPGFADALWPPPPWITEHLTFIASSW